MVNALAESVSHPAASSVRAVSICIVSHKAYGAFTGGKAGHIGGVEWQTSLLAKWLAARGHNVSLITWDEGGPPVEVIDSVKIIKVCRQNAGVKGLRFFHPKWTGLNRALGQADAEVYYHNTAECVTGQIALWCARHRRAFVFSSACDTDCDAAMPLLETPWERRLFAHGLRHAQTRIVQTETQREMLEKGFGLDSVVIPMPCPEPVADPAKTAGHRALWIARVCLQKRPDRLLDLAEACPEIMFDMVGPVYEDDYARAVQERALQIPNVTVHGPASREKVASFYRNAACLCSTSDFEGFPNTFLEAWSYGLPIISTFDPDNVIAKHRLGAVAKEVPALAAALRGIFASSQRREEIANNARRYFKENHALESVMPKFETVLLDAARMAVKR